MRALAAYHPWSLPRRLTLVAGWLALSLLVGGQAAWTLRPFFGVRSIPGAETRFFLGSSPDYRGSTNFYEAVTTSSRARRSRPTTSCAAAAGNSCRGDTRR